MRCDEGKDEISCDEIALLPALAAVDDNTVVVTSATQIHKLLCSSHIGEMVDFQKMLHILWRSVPVATFSTTDSIQMAFPQKFILSN